MTTLAQNLGETAPASLLARKTARFGVRDVDDAIALAARRGCRHYGSHVSPEIPEGAGLTDEELAIYLMAGSHRYEPMAIRCAAQLCRSPRIDPRRLARLARLYRTERVLVHIVRAGIAHDAEGRDFWETVLAHLPAVPVRSEPDLPHWSRFVSMPGYQRGGIKPPQWLVPQRDSAE